jgi:hypothetical protein
MVLSNLAEARDRLSGEMAQVDTPPPGSGMTSRAESVKASESLRETKPPETMRCPSDEKAQELSHSTPGTIIGGLPG